MTNDPENPSDLGDEEDPIVEECVRDALGPYRGALSPEELADYRRFLVVFITTHPAAVPLYERLRKRRATVARSGDMIREDAAVPDAEQARGDGTSGRAR